MKGSGKDQPSNRGKIPIKKKRKKGKDRKGRAEKKKGDRHD